MPRHTANQAQRGRDPEWVRGRVLEVFSAKAKREGIRAVMMAELATELRMSATTLYKLFPSKEALTLACVERWALELGAAEAAEAGQSGAAASLDGFERFTRWVEVWADTHAALSPVFARDLRSDYPAAWQRFREIIRQRKRRGAELLRPLLKSDVDEKVAFALLEMIMREALRPEFAQRLSVSRSTAIRTAVSIWAAGALDRRGQLRQLPGGAQNAPGAQKGGEAER